MDISSISMDIYQALTEKKADEVLSLCQTLQAHEGPMHVVTIHGDSVLHVALYSMQVKLAENLLNMSSYDRRLLALLSCQNAVGNTVLHEAATHDDFLSVAKKLLEIRPDLLFMPNYNSETPLFSAARYGQMKMFKFLDEEPVMHEEPVMQPVMQPVMDEEPVMQPVFGRESRERLHENDDGSTILHAAIDAEHFELAFWIAKKHKYLSDKKNKEGMTALQLLACNPLAFQFGGKGWLKAFIDSRIRNNNEDEDSTHLHEEKVTSRYRVPWWDEMLRKRRRYNVVVELVKLLIKNDISWKDTEYVGTTGAETSEDEEDDETSEDEENDDETSEDKENDESTVIDSKNGGNKIEAELKKIEAQLKKINQHELKKIEAQLKKIEAQLKKTDQGQQKKIEAKKKKAERRQIPLLLATQTGCFEIVDEILKLHPQAVEHIDNKGRSILHIAIKYRQMVIFDRVLNKMEVHARRLIQKCDLHGNSILHMVGKEIRNEAAEQTEKRSPFFRLQDDLLLFERIKEVIKPHFYKHRNRVGQTAEELLALNNEALRDKSQESLKRTAENFSINSALILTVAFTAAYTVPGGSKSDGSPVLLNQTFFIVFAICDVLSLTFCLTAVVTFMWILTSSFKLQEFKLALPQKLMLGITCLLLSVTMIILAFSATIILMVHHNEQYWTKIALYTGALLSVTVLAIVYIPLFLSFGKTFKYSLSKVMFFFLGVTLEQMFRSPTLPQLKTLLLLFKMMSC